MAKTHVKYEYPEIKPLTTKEAMGDPDFRKYFDKKIQFIRELNVAYVKIENDFELHCFEPYCALYFKTHVWNSFKTH